MYTDFNSDVMKRAVQKSLINTAEDCFIISLVTKDRTLDVELVEADHVPLKQALQILIEFYQESLPQWLQNQSTMSPNTRRLSKGDIDEEWTTSLLHAATR